MMRHLLVLNIVSLLLLLISASDASLNLYVNTTETQRLLGQSVF